MADERLGVTIEAYTDGYKQGLRDAWKETEEFTENIEDSSKSIQKSSKQIGGAAQVFIGTMAVQAISKLIQAGVQGMDTVYQFASKTGTSFKGAMDDVYSSFQGVKTALGSTFATVLTALAPIISQICDLIITAANAISYFFAALTGQSGYTKVSKTAQAYGGLSNNLGSAAGNAEKLKKSLLGIDEINALSDNSSSGGGGGGGAGGGGGLDGMEWVDISNTGLGKLFNAIRESKAFQAIKGFLSDIVGIITGSLGPAVDFISGLILGDSDLIQKAIKEIQNLIASNETLNKVVKLGGKIMTWVQNAIDDVKLWINDLFEGFLEIPFVSEILEILGVDVDNLSKNLANNRLELQKHKGMIAMNQYAFELWADGVDEATVNATRSIATASLNGVIELNKIRDGANNAKSSIQDTTTATNILAATKYDGSNISGGMWNIYSNAWLAADQIAKVQKAVKELSQGTYEGITIGITAAVTKGYASGGFPETGEIFVAREAGPEMVGTVNGTTAVATNNDIVAAVSQGVFEAVAQAMGGGRESSNIEVVVNMDGETVARAADRGNRALNRRYSVSLA